MKVRGERPNHHHLRMIPAPYRLFLPDQAILRQSLDRQSDLPKGSSPRHFEESTNVLVRFIHVREHDYWFRSLCMNNLLVSMLSFCFLVN